MNKDSNLNINSFDNNDLQQSNIPMGQESQQSQIVQETVQPQQPVQTQVAQELAQPQQPVQTQVIQEPAQPQYQNVSSETSKKNKKIYIVLLVVILIALLIVLLVINNNKKTNKDNTEEQPDIKNPIVENEDVKEEKELLNLMVLGGDNSGKAELLSKITKSYGIEVLPEKVNSCDEIRERGLTISLSKFNVETKNRKYTVTYACNQINIIKTLIFYGNKNTDGVVLVISASEGITPQVSEQFKILSQIGVTKLIIYLNEDLSDTTKINEIKNNIKETLTNNNFESNNTQMIVGNMDEKSVQSLMDEIDKTFVKDNKNLIIPVEDIFTITGRATVATGRIENGLINVNDKVEIVGSKGIKNSSVTNIEMNREYVDTAKNGDNVGIFLNDITRDNIERGDVIATPGIIKPYKKFNALIYVLSKEENTRATEIPNNHKAQFYIRTSDFTGTISLPKNIEKINVGEKFEISVVLEKQVALSKGTSFQIRESGRTIAVGVVTSIIE